MQFRNLSPQELEGSTEIDGLDEWLHTIGATDASLLILAPPGTGKAAAVGHVAHRLGREVLLGNLLQLFDHEDPDHQLEVLLNLCAAEKDRVILLEKLDGALRCWSERESAAGERVARILCGWLRNNKQKLLEDNCTLVFTGRSREALPDSLVGCFDKSLVDSA